MTLENLRNYLETAEEKYPISTEFTKDYQQSPANKNGYVYYAWKHGLNVCKKTADPSQKWHFLEAYTGLLLADPSNNITQSTDGPKMCCSSKGNYQCLSRQPIKKYGRKQNPGNDTMGRYRSGNQFIVLIQ